MKKILMVVIFLSILIFSCEKKEITKNNIEPEIATWAKDPEPVPEGWTNWSAAQNSSNPFDSVGQIHNEALDYAITEAGGYNILLSDSLLYAKLVFGYYSTRYGSHAAGQFASYFPITLFQDLADNVRNGAPLQGISLSQDVEDKLNDLFDVLEDTTRSDYDDYSSIKSIIVNWESDINSMSISANEKMYLFVAGSIARFSFLFWHKFYMTFEYDQCGTTSKKKLRWWQWIIVGFADVVGGVAAGGWGPVGVVAGAATASGVTYISQPEL
jgi:hypothetical protein